MNDRRAAKRVSPREPLKAKVFASFPVRVLDISERGAQLEVERSLRPNVGCELRFPSPEGEFILRATVRRCRAWGFRLTESDHRVLVFRAGVEFDNPHPELLKQLRLTISSDALRPVSPHDPMPAAQVQDKESVEEKVPLARPEPAGPQDVSPAAGNTPARPVISGPVKIRIRSDHVRRILGS